ncbi:MAG: hypothetical protein EOM55_01715 [Clostridia bacterium]|nr:hypothetical protein [Clostridia bacterium]
MFKKHFSEEEKKYYNIIKNHRKNVKQAFELLQINFGELFANLTKKQFNHLKKQIDTHDLSKLKKEEFKAYCINFFCKEKTEIIQNNFDMACLHHHRTNPHHHQYWLLKRNDGELVALDIPQVNLLEMICDWWAFSIQEGDLCLINSWYETYKDKMILSKKTRETVEEILNKIKTKFKKIISF